MTYQEVVNKLPAEQIMQYSVTCLNDECRGQIYDSPIMTAYDAQMEKQIYEANVTSIESKDGIIKLYLRHYIEHSQL